MAKITDKKEEKPAVKMRVYTPEELKKFDGLVQKYYYDHTLKSGEIIKVLNRKKLMVAYGAINEEGAVLVGDGFGDIGQPPFRIHEFENLYDQWQRWKGKINYGEEKKLEDLDKLAESMKAPEVVEMEF